jgi:hypothetical protein
MKQFMNERFSKHCSRNLMMAGISGERQPRLGLQRFRCGMVNSENEMWEMIILIDPVSGLCPCFISLLTKVLALTKAQVQLMLAKKDSEILKCKPQAISTATHIPSEFISMEMDIKLTQYVICCLVRLMLIRNYGDGNC